MEGDLESVVSCPACGQKVAVTLEKDNDDEIKTILEKMPGMKVEAFEGAGKCKSCGVRITASLTVIAKEKKEGTA